MDLRREIRDLLAQIGPGQMTLTAYDTAWVARLGEIGEPLGISALEWLRENQLEDGSWGARPPLYYHDRVICTLAAMNALSRQGRAQDRERLRYAEIALNAMIPKLGLDSIGETVGFELIVPTLLKEALALGGLHKGGTELLVKLASFRSAKLSALPDGIVNRFVTVAHSAEMAGFDGMKILDVDNLQEPNGSVGHSPSATAYFARYVRRKDPRAIAYLYEAASGGGVPNVFPFDIFESAWVLWNLSLIQKPDDELIALCQPQLDFLQAAWKPGKGVGFAVGYTPQDGDDTSLAYEVLSRFGRPVDWDTLQHYEHVYHYRCFDLESTPSISANAHILDALKSAGLDWQHSSIQKLLFFLKQLRVDGKFWLDKWHASPYYATAHVVIAMMDYTDDCVADAISWILETQHEDGSWGHYMPTAEETAYCLQALIVWQQHGNVLPEAVLNRGVAWLENHATPPYPPLWVGKCLYCPELVVRAAIVGVLATTIK